MGTNTGIAWTDHTWNPWQGCRKVSPGCANCYMYRDKARYGQDPATVIRSSTATFNSPLRWKEPARVFVCSWSDFFIEDADEWREDAWEIMHKTPHITYQILTKRPENIAERLPMAYRTFGGMWPLQNVWLGVTAENQEMADKRIPILLKTPAALRFVSIEPMVGPVDLERVQWPQLHKVDVLRRGAWDVPGWFPGFTNHGDMEGLDWVIVGGETGPAARMMHPEWALSIKGQCHSAGVPFFFKQMTNKTEVPDGLRVQEFPAAQTQGVEMEEGALFIDRDQWKQLNANNRRLEGTIKKLRDQLSENDKKYSGSIKELVEALEHICTKNPWLVMDQEFSVKTKQLLSEHRKP